MAERTLIIIKPESIKLKLEGIIHAELAPHGKRMITARVDAVPREIIEAHYAPHKDKPFFKRVVNYFTGKPVILSIYEGKDVIQNFRKIIGPSDPSKAPKNTIRGKYSDDSMEKAIAEQRSIYTLVHCSESVAEYKREMSVWKEYFAGFNITKIF
ncbi:hypothetical protein A3K74_01900 [Candidatus Pacearchaeota archaeon RBG_13_33_26]|nr:MAG: hypothetical protein A3K74_01900 [Candidatus Pacearchaeota archaeon RBG_13_33_26]